MAQNQKSGGIGQMIFILIVIVALFFISPGMLLMSMIKNIIGINFDVGQIWIFSLIVSGILFIAVYFSKRKNLKAALKHYLIICFAVIFIGLVSHFGFHAEWPKTYIQNFIPEE